MCVRVRPDSFLRGSIITVIYKRGWSGTLEAEKVPASASERFSLRFNNLCPFLPRVRHPESAPQTLVGSLDAFKEPFIFLLTHP